MLRWVPVVVLAACKFEERTFGDAAVFDSSNINCNNDPFEPNNTRTTATPGNIASGQFTADGVSICPENDIDMYAVVVQLQSNIEVVTLWEDGPVVDTALLNAGGTSLMNGEEFTATSRRACVTNLPSGTYIGFATGTGRNNYTLTIRLVSACTGSDAAPSAGKTTTWGE